MTFRSSILAGTVLTRAAMQSPNYEQGSVGWKISQDGTAEFNDITARGSITATSLTAGSSTGAQVIIDQSSGLGRIRFPTNAPEESQASSMNSGRSNQGAANEFLALDILGPAVTGHSDYIWTSWNSQASDGSSNANLSFNYNSGGADHSIATMDKTQVTINEPLALNGATTVFNNFVVTGTSDLKGHVTAEADLNVNGNFFSGNFLGGTIIFHNGNPVSSSNYLTGTFTFGKTFNNPPLVFLTPQDNAPSAGTTQVFCTVTGVTTSQCTIKYYRNTTNEPAGQTIGVMVWGFQG